MKIRAELTCEEYDEVMWCIGNYTDANARDIDEMMKSGMNRKQIRRLFSAESKLRAARKEAGKK